MADNPYLSSANPMQLNQLQELPPELQSEYRSINRQQRLADLLSNQAMQQPQGQMVSGRYVAPSFFQNIAPMVNAALGNYATGKAEERQSALASALREGGQKEMQQFNAIAQGSEGQPGDLAAALRYAQSAQYSPQLRNISSELMKPRTMKKGEEFVLPSVTGGQATVLAKGAPDLPTTVQEYEYAVKNQGYKGSLQDFRQSMRPVSNTVVQAPHGAAQAGVDANGNPVFFQMGPNGKIAVVQGVAPAPEKVQFAPAGSVPIVPGQPMPKFIPKTIEGTNLSFDAQGNPIIAPVAGASAANAGYKGAETTAVEQAKATQDLVPVVQGTNTVLVPRSEVLASALRGEPSLSKPDTKALQAVSVNDLANRARQVLPQASSGIISNIATMAASAGGIETNKANADAQLKILGGQLTSNVPRMEGPQSDKDVQLYKQMAGDIANPNVPYGTRIKALNTIIDLNQKYLPQQSAAPSAPVSTAAPTPEQAREILRQRGIQ